MISKQTKMIKDYLKEIGFGNVRVVKSQNTQAQMHRTTFKEIIFLCDIYLSNSLLILSCVYFYKKTQTLKDFYLQIIFDNFV